LMPCTLPNATETCMSGSCQVVSCFATFGNCNPDQADGCETSLLTNSNCGGCGASCAPANGTGSCPSGVCVVTGCDAGFDDCDMMDGNGCETSLATSADCGMCDVMCSGGQVCRMGSCVTGAARCGDGAQDPGEECDDGNRIDDDGCENDCTATMCTGTVVCNYRSIGTVPNYALGNVNATNGSVLVRGNGTSWVTANRGRGDRITIGSMTYVVSSVDAADELTLMTPFVGTATAQTYSVARAFSGLTPLQDWERCVSGGAGGCGVADLVMSNRSEIGVVYNDSPLTGALALDGTTGNATHMLVLTAAVRNRHFGIPNRGARLNGVTMLISDGALLIEWLEISNTTDHAMEFASVDPPGYAVLRYNLFHDIMGQAIRSTNGGVTLEIYNNIFYSCEEAIRINQPPASAQVFSNTVYGCTMRGIGTGSGGYGGVTLRNNLVMNSPPGANIAVPGVSMASSNNFTSDATGTAHSFPVMTGRNNVTAAQAGFASPAAGDFHIGAGSIMVDAGADLSSRFRLDIDSVLRTPFWDVGADQAP